MQTEAVKQIRSWIYANANDTYAGEYPGYSIRKEMDSGATGFFTLYCENDPATVQLAVDYYFDSGSAACITMDLPAESAVTNVHYFYARAESEYWDATGKMEVHNAYFTEGTVPDFTRYTGAEYFRASDAEICVLLIKLGLAYLDVLLPAMGAAFTPADRSVFGFPAG